MAPKYPRVPTVPAPKAAPPAPHISTTYTPSTKELGALRAKLISKNIASEAAALVNPSCTKVANTAQRAAQAPRNTTGTIVLNLLGK